MVANLRKSEWEASWECWLCVALSTLRSSFPGGAIDCGSFVARSSPGNLAARAGGHHEWGARCAMQRGKRGREKDSRGANPVDHAAKQGPGTTRGGGRTFDACARRACRFRAQDTAETQVTPKRRRLRHAGDQIVQPKRGLPNARYEGVLLNSPTGNPCEILRRCCLELHERLRNFIGMTKDCRS